MQNISKFMVGKSSLQLNGKRRLISGRFHTLIWRQGDTVQNLESPGLSGRVDSTVYMCGPYLCDSSKHSTNLERVITALIILQWLLKRQQILSAALKRNKKVCGKSMWNVQAKWSSRECLLCGNLPLFLEKTSRSTFLLSKFRFTATLTIFRGFSWYINLSNAKTP